ncbi:PREDICTED: centrosomal protein of 128 kDa-like isoform X2 [Cyprinodon variegatus]|nr:PREDICTED: centrosomal protein of 128 kDa-like isoform X2 [Cyprinodon variegatus]
MGGYFKCVEKLWKGYQTGEDLLASLPTLDMDGETISPLSEEDDETTEDKDFKVVEKKRYVASTGKTSQPWYTRKERSNEKGPCTKKPNDAGYRTQRGRGKATRRISTWTPLSMGTSSSKSKESDKDSEESESGLKLVTKAGGLPAETEMTVYAEEGNRAKGPHQNESGKMPNNDGDATDSGARMKQCNREVAEPHIIGRKQSSLGGEDNTDRFIIVTKERTKKRGGDDYVDKGKGQQEENKHERKDLRREERGQSEDWSEDDFVRITETSISSQDRREEMDALETREADGRHVPKKKRKKTFSSSNLHQTQTEHLEAIDQSEHEESAEKAQESIGSKRKKHKKQKHQLPSDENQTDAAAVVENTNFTVKKKKTKRVSELIQIPEEGESVDDTLKEKQDVELENRWRSSSFLTADQEEEVDQLHEEQLPPLQSASAHTGCSRKPEVSSESADGPEHVLESGGGKKKKKRSARVLEREESEAEETSEAAVRKKKRKRNKSLMGTLESVSDEGHSQLSALVKKKKKQKGTQEVPPSAAEPAESENSSPNVCSSLHTSRKLFTTPEGKHSETSHVSGVSTEKRVPEPLTEGASGPQTSGHVIKRSKKKHADRNDPNWKSFHETPDTQTKEDRTKPQNGSMSTQSKSFPGLQESSSLCNKRKKEAKAKRRLHNPDEDFLSDLNP